MTAMSATRDTPWLLLAGCAVWGARIAHRGLDITASSDISALASQPISSIAYLSETLLRVIISA
jgi:hypothetical protein